MNYMNWIGHFEFGTNVKPFKVQQNEMVLNLENLMKLDSWLWYWNSVYSFIIDHYSSDVYFFDYDRFCKQPKECLTILELTLLLSDGSLKEFSSRIKPAKTYKTVFKNNSIPSQVKNTYFKLQEMSI